MFLLLLFTGALACDVATNNPINVNTVAGTADCIYPLKLGAAVPAFYSGEWGIEAAVDDVNSYNKDADGNGYIELGNDTPKKRFQVTFKNYAFSDTQQDADEIEHATQVNDMLSNEEFIIGGGPWYAEQEVGLTNQDRKVSVLCCTGPDKVYEKADQSQWNGAFGVHAPPEYYPQGVIRKASEGGATKIAIIWAYGNVFTTQVADKNKVFAESLGMTVTTFKSYPFISSPAALSATNDGVSNAKCPTAGVACENQEALGALGKEVYDNGAEVVVVCGMNQDAYYFAKEFQIHDPYNEQFKAIFFTVGPTKPNWMAETSEAGQYITSGGQWDPNIAECGEWFGPGWPQTKRDDYCSVNWSAKVEAYVAANKATQSGKIAKEAQAFGSNYEAASGGVAVFTLLKGIALAYEDQSITLGSWDHDLVKKALEDMHAHTFFGNIGFNGIQRNTAKEPAAIQWVPNANGNAFEKKVIFPESGQEVPLVYPIPQCKDNTVSDPDCKELPSEDNDDDEGEDKKDGSGLVVIIVVLVVAVLLLIAVVVYMRNKAGKGFMFDSSADKSTV